MFFYPLGHTDKTLFQNMLYI